MQSTLRTATFAIAACILASGCVDVYRSYSPQDGADLWVDTNQSPIAMHSWGCGFCSGDPDRPEFWATILDDTGGVLHIGYGRGREPGVEIPNPEYRQFQRMLEATFEMEDLYGASEGIRIHEVRAATLSTDDHGGVTEAISKAMKRAGPSTGQVEWTDCGPAQIHVWHQATWHRSQNGCGIEAGAGWSLILNIMEELEQWIVRNDRNFR